MILTALIILITLIICIETLNTGNGSAHLWRTHSLQGGAIILTTVITLITLITSITAIANYIDHIDHTDHIDPSNDIDD